MLEQVPGRIRVTAASVNTRQAPGNVRHNFEKIVTQIHWAHKVGAQLVLTPELVLDGMFVYQIRPYLSRSAEKQKEITQLTNAYVDLAQTIEQTYLPQFSELSRALQIYIGLGTAEHHDGGVYNSILLFSPNGEIVARYRKVNALFEVATKEHHRFDVFHTPIGSIGGMICADFVMTESWRIQRLKGARLVLWSSGGTTAPMEKKSLCTHAYQNGYYILASNHEGGMSIDPDGRIITETNEPDELVTSSIDYQKTNLEGLCFSRDLSAYGPLMDESLEAMAEEDGRESRAKNDYENHEDTIENPNHVEEADSQESAYEPQRRERIGCVPDNDSTFPQTLIAWPLMWRPPSQHRNQDLLRIHEFTNITLPAAG